MPRKIILLVSVLLFAQAISAQVHQRLNENYATYKDSSITDRRFKHEDIVRIITALPERFHAKVVGQSIEGRDIYLLRLGDGPKKVLLWSQMHGDETTATQALIDIFNFFRADDRFNDLRQQILDECTLYFIPLLNPDGAERFQRRNALGIDLNRDALRLQCPESRILKAVRDSTEADWGFNLHDQNRYYSAGAGNEQTAAISFLAPAYNYEKDVNQIRERAMQLIGVLNDMVQHYLPGQVGKYSDAFEPRAFGDNIQKWGTSTILIETGGLAGDRNKQELRRINFLMLMRAFESIADDSYASYSRRTYNSIPFNDYGAFQDLLIKQVEVQREGEWYTVDLAMRLREIDYNDYRNYYLEGYIEDIGDLSVYYGYETLNAQGLRAYPGKVYPKIMRSVKEAAELDVLELYEQGFTTVQVAAPVPNDNQYHSMPLRLVNAFPGNSAGTKSRIAIGNNPSLLLKDGDEQLRYAIINGQLFDASALEED